MSDNVNFLDLIEIKICEADNHCESLFWFASHCGSGLMAFFIAHRGMLDSHLTFSTTLNVRDRDESRSS